jgi:hypothetical protein
MAVVLTARQIEELAVSRKKMDSYTITTGNSGV